LAARAGPLTAELHEQVRHDSYLPASASNATSGRYRGGVGLNALRAHVARRNDLVMVIATLAVVLALVLWALLG